MATTIQNNPYLEEALRKLRLANAEKQNEIARQSKESLQLAQATQTAARDSAGVDYRRYINPYGVQAETMAQKGLRNSGLSQTAQSRAYGAYMNRLGQAQEQYSRAAGDIASREAQSLSELRQQDLQQQAAYQQSLYDDSWRTKLYDYQVAQDEEDKRRYEAEMAYRRERDAIEDRRYDQEWAYSLRKGSAGGGSGRTSSGRRYSSGGGGSSSLSSYAFSDTGTGTKASVAATVKPVSAEEISRAYSQSRNSKLSALERAAATARYNALLQQQAEYRRYTTNR